MNPLRQLIMIDLSEHPDSSINEIAARVFCCHDAVSDCLTEIAKIVKPSPVRRHNNGSTRGRFPARYSLRDGIVNWCPHCGHIMEKVGR